MSFTNNRSKRSVTAKQAKRNGNDEKTFSLSDSAVVTHLSVMFQLKMTIEVKVTT